MNEGGNTARVAYIMSRFPKLTETFVLYEILALEAIGTHVEIFPLLRQREPTMHPEARPLVDRARYLPFLSPAVLRSQWRALRRAPRGYLGALLSILRHGVGSRNYLIGGLAIFPKAVHAGEIMRATGITHLHCHFSNHPATAGFIINRTTGIPFSFTAHGSDLHVDRHMLAMKVAAAEFVVTVSEFNRSIIAKECGPRLSTKVEVLHCGVDIDVFHPGEDHDGVFRITCVGTLHEVKGQRYLIEACALLDEAGATFECHLVGEGEDEGALRALARSLGIEERVVFAGRRTRDEIAELLRRSSVLVAPSVPAADGKREGIPVVLMEGMSTALPVVASRLSGIPELVVDEKCGLLVEPRDVAGLAGALRRVYDDPELRKRLGTSARSWVATEFNLRTNAARLAARFQGTGGR